MLHQLALSMRRQCAYPSDRRAILEVFDHVVDFFVVDIDYDDVDLFRDDGSVASRGNSHYLDIWVG